MVSAMEPMYKSDKSKKRGTVVLQWLLLTLLFVHPAALRVVANSEVEALRAVRRHLIDPAKVLQSWDPDLINPCTYFHVTCNSLNQVIRIDLGNAELSGKLPTEIVRLPHLQYLELYGNYISGKIPKQLGKLSNLVSLDLYENNFTGTIPATLGKLQNLRFLRLNNNALHGKIPVQLTTIQGLQDLDLSNNSLSGEVPTNGSFSLFGPSSFEGNEGLCGAPTPRSCPISEPPLLAPIAPEPSTPNT